MSTRGLKLKHAAKKLRKAERILRKHLIDIGAIEKWQFGWRVTERYKDSGYLFTSNRQTQIHLEGRRPMNRHYTIILITSNGMRWLHNNLCNQEDTNHESKQQAASSDTDATTADDHRRTGT